jgi:hypothetical protein
MTPEYKERRRLKHLSQNGPGVVLIENIYLGPSPDGLGLWEGGPQELKSAPNWVALKSRATRTADWKNTPGKSGHEVVERSADWYKQGNNTPKETPADVAPVV